MHNPRASTGLTDSSEAPSAPSALFHIRARSYPQSGDPTWTTMPSVHDESAREEVPHPLADARERVRAVGAGVTDRLLADVVRAPQQQADGGREGRIADLVHQSADSLWRADAHGHVERVAREHLDARQAGAAAGQDRPGGKHPRVPGTLDLLADEAADFAHAGLDDLAQLAALNRLATGLAEDRDIEQILGLHLGQVRGSVLDLDLLGQVEAGAQADGDV